MTSPTLPAVGFLGPRDAADVARASNEYAARPRQDFPGRFGMFAPLPLPHVDETLKEIAYAFDVLKADGVAFMTSYGDKFLGDASFAPVWNEIRCFYYDTAQASNPVAMASLTKLVPTSQILFSTD
jgi:hypothetical protein